MRRISPLLAFVACAFASGCSSSGGTFRTDAGEGDLSTVVPDLATTVGADLAMPSDAGGSADLAGKDAGPAVGDPISSPLNQWTWVDFSDSVCDDGTPTGIGIRRTSSPNLLIFFNGGGACWDYATCVTLNTSAHGPFGAAQFNQVKSGVTGTILGDGAGNPFDGWNLIFVPYCTGDVHVGDKVMTYTSNGQSKVIHHKGRANVLAYLRRLTATFANPAKLVVAGSSAGGLGALLNYDLVRVNFPSSQGYLVDDSGQALVGDAISSSLRTAWYSSWNLDATIGSSCVDCKTDLSQMAVVLSGKYSNDRMALLSYTQDQTMRTYYMLSATAFETDLRDMLSQRLDPTANFKYFIQTGSSHTMLGDPLNHTVNGTSLVTWGTQMVGDDAAWKSILP